MLQVLGKYILKNCSKFKRLKEIFFYFLFIHIYPTPPLGQDMTQGHFF